MKVPLSTSPPPLVVNAALTGMVPTKADNPALPVTPAEIAHDAERCLAAGASIVHLHARDGSGSPTYRREVYEEILDAVRDRCPEILVCVSTSGRLFRSLEERADVLALEGAAKPELASLTLGSLNFPKQASINEPHMIRGLAERMRERDIVPELEVFDLGMIDYAHYLIDRDVLAPPYYFNLLLGSLGTIAATPSNLLTLVAALPDDAVWSATGIGRFQFGINAIATTVGGHVRVGLEDNLYLDADRQRLATNEELVERVVRVSDAVERPVATPQDARALLGVPARV